MVGWWRFTIIKKTKTEEKREKNNMITAISGIIAAGFRPQGQAGGALTAPTHVVSNGFFDANALTVSRTFSVSGGSNRLMLVMVGQGNTANNIKTILSVIWTGGGIPQNLTAIPGFTVSDGNFCSLVGYYLIAPNLEEGGSVTATFASSPNIEAIVVSLYTGASQSNPFGTAVTASQTNATVVSVTAATTTGQINWAGTANDANGAITIGGTASPTSRYETEGVNSDMGFSVGDTTGSGTITWTWAGSDNGGVIATIPVIGI